MNPVFNRNKRIWVAFRSKHYPDSKVHGVKMGTTGPWRLLLPVYAFCCQCFKNIPDCITQHMMIASRLGKSYAETVLFRQWNCKNSYLRLNMETASKKGKFRVTFWNLSPASKYKICFICTHIPKENHNMNNKSCNVFDQNEILIDVSKGMYRIHLPTVCCLDTWILWYIMTACNCHFVYTTCMMITYVQFIKKL